MTGYPVAGKLGIDRLFHYQSFRPDFAREVVVDGVLHFSKPSDFNDPWDCKPWFDSEGLKDPMIFEDHLRYYIDITRKHRRDISEDAIAQSVENFRANPALLAAKIPEFSEAMGAAINEQYRVYCVTPKPNSELMWAHYAAKHQGICLEFGVRNDVFYSALQVQYLHTYPVYRMTGYAGPDEHLAPLYTKSAAWSYEEEFRLISDERGDPSNSLVTVLGKQPLPRGSLKAVIMGCLAPDSTKQAVADLVAASPHKPQLKFATRMKDQYQLQIS